MTGNPVIIISKTQPVSFYIPVLPHDPRAQGYEYVVRPLSL